MTPLRLAAAGPTDTIFLPLLVLIYWLPYRARVRRLAASGRSTPLWRQWCYGGGLIVLAVALSPPLGRLADQLLLAHMVEHLLIGDLAALLIVLGLTGPILAPLLRNRVLGPLRIFTQPAVAVPIWAVNFYLWHLPVLYQAALRHDAVHALEHATFLAFGMAMWMGLLGPLPKPAWFGNGARLVYIVVVRLLGTVLANAMIFSGTVFYPYYRGGDAHWHISPMADQIAAAGVMMVEESLLTIALFCWLFLKVAAEVSERQRLLDLAAEHGVVLDERRAARAVAAGRGRELQERLLAGAAAAPQAPVPAAGTPAGAGTGAT